MGVNDDKTSPQSGADKVASEAAAKADAAKADVKAATAAADKAATDAKAAGAAKPVDPVNEVRTKRIRIREESLVDVVVDESGFELKKGDIVDAGYELADRLLARPGQEVELLEIYEHGSPS